MIWLYVILSVLAFCVLAFFAGALFAYFFVFYVPRREREAHYRIPRGPQFDERREELVGLIRTQETVPFERVFTTAYDGTKLAARYYHVRDGAPLQIQFHGYRGTSVRDFCGGNRLARENGINTLVVDQRGHGLSGGHTLTLGVKERRDCLSWIDYALARFGNNVVITLAGVSMGAATVLMAAGLGLPENVKGIIADSPYTTPKEMLLRVGRDNHIPIWLVYPLVAAAATFFGGFRLTDASALDAVSHTHVPILFIHGEDDRFVPKEMSEELAKACAGHAERVTFPGAAHGISYVADPARYADTVLRFLLFCGS